MTKTPLVLLLALAGAACGGRVAYVERGSASGGLGAGDGPMNGRGGAVSQGGTSSTGGRERGSGGLGGNTATSSDEGGASDGRFLDSTGGRFLDSTGAADQDVSTGGSSACGLVIDDMESGSGFICEGEGRRGYWYAFNDTTGKQEPFPTDNGVPILPERVTGGTPGETRAMHTWGDGFTGWGAGIGFFLYFDGRDFRSYDASSYRGIRFYARSDQRTVLHVRINSGSTTPTEYGGTCTTTGPAASCNPYTFDVELDAEWETYEVLFSDILQGVCPTVDPGRITSIDFMGSWDEESPSFDFWIDEVSFVPAPSHCDAFPGCTEGITLDPGLEAAVRSVSGRHAGPLSCYDVYDIIHLCAGGHGITSLAGAECLTKLTHFDIADNAVVDLEPLAGLTGLTWLALSSNQVTDIEPLSNLTELTWLSLYDNGIESIEALSTLTALESLSLYDNEIVEVDGLSGLTSLNWLSLSSNRITHLDGLAAVSSLYSLWLDDNDISDVTPLTSLALLHVLDLRNNQVQTVAPLVANPGLGSEDDLYLSENPIDCGAEAANIQELVDRGVDLVGADCLDATD